MFLLSIMAGCGGKKTEGPAPEVVEPAFTAADTAEVYDQTNRYLEFLKASDLDGALSMIYAADSTGAMQPLSAEQSKGQKGMLSMFIGLEYRIQYLIFNNDRDNELKYSVILFPKTDEKDTRPNEVPFVLCPVRSGGKWYLTLANGAANGKQ